MTGNITIGGEDLGTADPWEAILALSRRCAALRAEILTAPVPPEKLVKAAREYDYANRPPMGNWSRVPDDQVIRLLIGARLLIKPGETDTRP